MDANRASIEDSDDPSRVSRSTKQAMARLCQVWSLGYNQQVLYLYVLLDGIIHHVQLIGLDPKPICASATLYSLAVAPES